MADDSKTALPEHAPTPGEAWETIRDLSARVARLERAALPDLPEVTEHRPGEYPALTLPLDQRIGENISVVRLRDVVGMPEELHGVTFVIDRPPDRLRLVTPQGRVGVYLDGAFRKKLDLITDRDGYAYGIIVAADALRGIGDDDA